MYSLSKMGQLTQANQLFEQAYQLRLKALGSLNVDVAVTRLNFARTERDLGHFKIADIALVEVVSVFETLFPEQDMPHPAMAFALSEYGISLRMQGRNIEAVKVFDRASLISNTLAKSVVFGPLRERAMAWLALEKTQEALADIDVCLVQAAKLPPGQMIVPLAGCQWRAAQIHLSLGNLSVAHELNAKALDGYRTIDLALVSQTLEKAQALVLQMRIAQVQGQNTVAQDARAQAKSLLQPLQEYWLAQQLIKQLDQ